jgi:hypothetical protein
MKAESYYMINESVYQNLIDRLCKVELDGKTKITICNAGSKSTKQRGLQWRWYDDISKSGVGGKHEGTTRGVDLKCKWLFAMTILLRDEKEFCWLWEVFYEKYEGNEEMIEYFVEKHVHTEQFNTSQMTEYLDIIDNYYTDKGVNLTDPREYGLKR